MVGFYLRKRYLNASNKSLYEKVAIICLNADALDGAGLLLQQRGEA